MTTRVRSVAVRGRVKAAIRKLDQSHEMAIDLADTAIADETVPFALARALKRDFREVATALGKIRGAAASAWIAFNEHEGAQRREPVSYRPRLIASRRPRELKFRDFRRKAGAATERIKRYLGAAQAAMSHAALAACRRGVYPEPGEESFQRAIAKIQTNLDAVLRDVRHLQVMIHAHTMHPTPLPHPDDPRSAWGADEAERKHRHTSARRARTYRRRAGTGKVIPWKS